MTKKTCKIIAVILTIILLSTAAVMIISNKNSSIAYDVR